MQCELWRGAAALSCFSQGRLFAPAWQNCARVGWRRSPQNKDRGRVHARSLPTRPAQIQNKPSAKNIYKLYGFCWRRIRKLSAIPEFSSLEECKGLRRTEGFNHLVNTPKASRKPQHSAKVSSAGSKRRKANTCNFKVCV